MSFELVHLRNHHSVCEYETVREGTVKFQAIYPEYRTNGEYRVKRVQLEALAQV